MKALTLVYLLAAATAASTYSTVVASAEATNLCSSGTIATTTLVDGDNVANQCELGEVAEEITFTFPDSLTERTSFKLTGKTDTDYGYVWINQQSSYPVDITIEDASMSEFSLYGDSLPSGSTVSFVNSKASSDFEIEINGYDTSILLSNSVFGDVTINFWYENYHGSNIALVVKESTFDNGYLYLDLDDEHYSTMTFANNTVTNYEISHYTGFHTDSVVSFTGNSFNASEVDISHQGGLFELSRNTFETSWIEFSPYSAAETAVVEDNVFACSPSVTTSLEFGSNGNDNSTFSFSRNTFGADCEVSNTIYFYLPYEFASNSSIAIADNVYTIGTAFSDHSLIYVYDSTFRAPYGPATFALTGNDFRFANGVKPKDLGSDAHLIYFDVSTEGDGDSEPVSRGMQQQGSEENQLQMSLGGNIVDGKVLATDKDMAAFFGGLAEVLASHGGQIEGITIVQAEVSAAPTVPSIATAAAALVAALMLFA